MAPVTSGREYPPVMDTPEYLSWGRYPRLECEKAFQIYWDDQVLPLLLNEQEGSLLPYGLGRSYGDVCLNGGRNLIDCSHLNHFISADFESGWIRCEAGVSLADILELTVPRGWFLPVTPGTRFVTVGGAIANDVHGKNHHRAGTFGSHVRKLALCRSDIGIVICSPDENTELFNATIGGLGLTGVILWCEIGLRAIHGASIDLETIQFNSLTEFLNLTEESDASHEYTVAWIDCLSERAGRGIFFCGNHSLSSAKARRKARRITVPFTFPEWVLNPLATKALNSLYRLQQRSKRGKRIVDYEPFFYPLDSILHWNLAYGRRGFVQYQCVVPSSAVDALADLLELVSASKTGSFLAVLKKFGSQKSPGLMSFPRPGLTLALDFPMRGESTLALLNTLDSVVLRAGGAVYPAKDARMSAEMFAASFPKWQEFQSYVDCKLSSSFWRRVTGEAK
ncbi:MAG TPA: FAD-binding oxidoreductase [Candidatus Angelobacter sp.]|nr:FAD-binding oxidoreductase [Candidatus Angelobacter sp.]